MALHQWKVKLVALEIRNELFVKKIKKVEKKKRGKSDSLGEGGVGGSGRGRGRERDFFSALRYTLVTY